MLSFLLFQSPNINKGISGGFKSKINHKTYDQFKNFAQTNL
uniref:Uncharacterized protein n=1 Tax=Rhizophora mucronata TaxID=61149 RepID=A0A2P2KGN2_RHIMU